MIIQWTETPVKAVDSSKSVKFFKLFFFRSSTAYAFSGAGSSLSFYYWDLSVVGFKMFATILMWNFENFHVERIFFL